MSYFASGYFPTGYFAGGYFPGLVIISVSDSFTLSESVSFLLNSSDTITFADNGQLVINAPDTVSFTEVLRTLINSADSISFVDVPLEFNSATDNFTASDTIQLVINNGCTTEEQEYVKLSDTFADIYLSKHLSLSFDIDPALFYSMLYTSNQSERIRWFKAFPNPNLSNPQTSVIDTLQFGEKYLLVEQNTKDYRALIAGGRAIRKYLPEGKLEEGDLLVSTSIDEMPISEDDVIIPVGRREFKLSTNPDARTFVHKEWVKRGELAVLQDGLVSSSGTTITGTGTNFLTQFVVGDLIKAGNQPVVIDTITSQISMTVTEAPSPQWTSNRFYKLTDKLSFPPVAFISYIADKDRTYTYGTDCTLLEDEQTIQWKTSVCPAYGTVYSVIYRYYPKYIVRIDLTRQRRPVNGVALPQTVLVSLMKPDTYK